MATGPPFLQKPTKNDENKLTCIQLNADTLCNKMPELSLIIREYNPDIISVSEVLPKCFKNTIFPEEFNIKGYNMIPHENVPKNKGRGSIIYIKEQFDFK